MIDEALISKAEVLRLRIWPDPFLHEVCIPFEDDYRQRVAVAANMIKTMRKHNGVGLAGPQIGQLRQICVVCAEGGSPLVIINPTDLIPDTSTAYRHMEGCLSIPGHFEERTRYASIKLTYEDVNGTKHTRTFNHLEAFVIQHELEHLDGNLFIDGLSRLKLDKIRRKVKKSLNK